MLAAVGMTQQGSVGIRKIRSLKVENTCLPQDAIVRQRRGTDPTILSNIDKLFETYEKAK